MPKSRWTAPRWMQPYLPHICNTGGNDLASMVNGQADPRVNLPLSTLQACVKSQVILLETLHREGMLPPPDVASVTSTLGRQRRALASIAAGVEAVIGSRMWPKKLRPGMEAIAEACRRGLGA